jgi:hypothetical protein
VPIGQAFFDYNNGIKTLPKFPISILKTGLKTEGLF